MAILTSIKDGIVIDHIKAGKGLKILNYLSINPDKDTVSLIMNAPSQKRGRKDIIKIENIIDIDLTALGFLDNKATVSIIKDEKVIKKIKLELPDQITGIIKCKNPRCVTSVEKNVPHIFILQDKEKETYYCKYCNEIISISNLENLF